MADKVDKPKAIVDLDTLAQFQRWQRSQGYASGEFVYALRTPGSSGGGGRSMLLTSKPRGAIKPKHLTWAVGGDSKHIDGSYTYDKKTEQWTFQIDRSEVDRTFASYKDPEASLKRALASALCGVGGPNIDKGAWASTQPWLYTETLEEFCETDSAPENLACLKLCYKLAGSAKEKELAPVWNEIMQSYVRPGVDEEVNIEHGLRTWMTTQDGLVNAKKTTIAKIMKGGLPPELVGIVAQLQKNVGEQGQRFVTKKPCKDVAAEIDAVSKKIMLLVDSGKQGSAGDDDVSDGPGTMLLDVMTNCLQGNDVDKLLKNAKKLREQAAKSKDKAKAIGYKPAELKKLKLELHHSKRKVFYTLSGPALGVGAVAAVAAIASGPFGLGAAMVAAAGALAGRGLIKTWRNLRAKHAKTKLAFLEKYNKGKSTIPRDAAKQIRFWLQKKKLSVVAEELQLLADAYEDLRKLKKPTFKTCDDCVLYLGKLYNTIYLLGQLMEDVELFLIFYGWIQDEIDDIENTYTPEAVARAMKACAVQAIGPNHKKCKKPCFGLNDKEMVISPEYKTYKTVGPWKQLPFGRLMGDAASRVFGGKNTTKLVYTIHTNEVIQMAWEMELHTAPKGVPNFMAVTGFPGQPPEFFDPHKAALSDKAFKETTKEFQKIFKTDSYTKDPSKSRGGEEAADAAKAGLGSYGLKVTGAVSKILAEAGLKTLKDSSTYEKAIQAALTSSAATLTGGAIAGLGTTGMYLFGEWKNLRNELNTYFKTKGDASKLKQNVAALRTILKEGGRFQAFVDQLTKAIKWKEIFEKEAKGSPSDCGDAYDLAVSILQVWKHRAKMDANREFIDSFVQIVAGYTQLLEGDELADLEQAMGDDVIKWMNNGHPDGECTGSCCFAGTHMPELWES